MSHPIQYHYYRTPYEKWDYVGSRYFKYLPGEDHVVQVVSTSGDAKKGKSNTVGVYLIGRITFVTNYLTYARVELCSKKEYEKAFETVFGYLK